VPTNGVTISSKLRRVDGIVIKLRHHLAMISSSLVGTRYGMSMASSLVGARHEMHMMNNMATSCGR
jgi:hypothetical protein